jgi:hypothetical protein
MRASKTEEYKVKTVKLAIPVILALTASGGYAAAIQLSVDNSASTTHFQQNFDDPCIFGGPDCQPAPGFPTETSIAVGGSVSIIDAGTVNNLPSNGQPVLFSATVAQITGLAGGLFGNTFKIGVDINEAGNGTSLPINILQFEVWDGATELAFLPTNTSLTAFANGTGFSDALLSSVSLAGLPTTDTIQFRLRYNGASDGTDSFFLVSTTGGVSPVVPEPISSALVGTGLISLFFLRRRVRG